MSTLGPQDIRGRAIAHYFFDELEKISSAAGAVADTFSSTARRAPHQLREMAQFELGQAQRAAEALPWYSRLIGGGRAARSQAQSRAQPLYQEMQSNMSDARRVMSDPSASAADREAAISYLEAGKAESPYTQWGGGFRTPYGADAPAHSRYQQLADPEATRTGDFSAKPADSPAMRAAKMVGAGTVLGGGGLLAGQYYLNNRAQQQGDYGGY